MVEIQKGGVTYVVGDLIAALESGSVGVIAHQANCFSIMGSGIAAAISREWPSVAAADRNDPRTHEDRLGSFSKCDVECGVVYNLYGQLLPGRHTDLLELRYSVREMVSDLLATGFSSVVGFPLIGCGIGGGDWGEVSAMLKEEMGDIPFVVYVLDKSVVVK